MSSLSETIRQKVRERAENRCEYCLSHQDYIMGRLQIDHIQPVAKGGDNTEDNLCLACELCNQYKWTQTEDLDPQSGKIISLFHPRQQQWQKHFTWSPEGTEIIGLTACGRATVGALRLNNRDVGWVKRQRNPTTLNHKITKTLNNIIQMQFPEVQINKTKCPKKLEN